ncbi:hypothetical protein GHK80_06605 [Sinorhizobium medicae]|nr:hypothetical protein [Sinorhizobium medicae]
MSCSSPASCSAPRRLSPCSAQPAPRSEGRRHRPRLQRQGRGRTAESGANLARSRVHRALSRPNLLMGADRELVLLTGLASVILIFVVLTHHPARHPRRPQKSLVSRRPDR